MTLDADSSQTISTTGLFPGNILDLPTYLDLRTSLLFAPTYLFRFTYYRRRRLQRTAPCRGIFSQYAFLAWSF